MSFNGLVQDLRVARGRIWNVRDVLHHFPIGADSDPWNRGRPTESSEPWIDEFVYRGYTTYGPPFLSHLKGRFAVAYFDAHERKLFLARDWIGELPLHILATATRILVANTVARLQREAGREYAYHHVRAFPHAHAQVIDLADIDPQCVGPTMSPLEQELYCDFDQLVSRATYDVGASLTPHTLNLLRTGLQDSIRRRAAGHAEPHAVLLSGGLDSFAVALTMKALGLPFEAYTLSVDGSGDDVATAADFARRLGVPHHEVRVSRREVVDVFEEAIELSEHYALYNVYCAVGMVLLARRLAGMGVRAAFCGEAVNEAVGDYRDWEVIDPATGQVLVLQRVNAARFQRSSQRKILVWGHPRDKGKYNKQLGSGLAKHAGSRMIKPFLAHGLTLECPYYDPQLLAHLVALPASLLARVGGKAGLFAQIFRSDLERFRIDADTVMRCKKVRLQDASEGAQGGITGVLLEAGCDQRRAIEIFKARFGANLDPDLDGRRLAWHVASQDMDSR